MPALLDSTQRALGGESLPDCDSRSLRLTRYARPDLKGTVAERYLRQSNPSDARIREIDSNPQRRAGLIEKLDARKDYLEAVTRDPREPAASSATTTWQRSLPGARTLHARLEARLLLNLAGTVLENAGLGLDRYGTVPIPGSALKGCARRAALATLRQWCETGQKPAGEGELLAAAAAPFNKPEDILCAILRIFGCTDLEWKDFDPAKNETNDLAWACGAGLTGDRDRWSACRAHALSAIGDPASPIGGDAAFPTRRGTVVFLPAYPSRTPTPDLELDVLTPHHKDYYADEDPHAIALDNEDPVPVFFPAVAAGAEYAFTLVPLGAPHPVTVALLDYAVVWLLTGLTTFGLGAKTAAGYGWFRSEEHEQSLKDLAQAEADRLAVAKKAALDAAPSDETYLTKLRAMKEDSLRGEINKYAAEPRFWPQESDQRRLTLVRYTTKESPGLWMKERVNPKSKVTKAIEALAKYLEYQLP